MREQRKKWCREECGRRKSFAHALALAGRSSFFLEEEYTRAPTIMATSAVPPTTIPTMHPVGHASELDEPDGGDDAGTSETLLEIVGGGMVQLQSEDSSEYHDEDVSFCRELTLFMTPLKVELSLVGICASEVTSSDPAASAMPLRRSVVIVPPLDVYLKRLQNVEYLSFRVRALPIVSQILCLPASVEIKMSNSAIKMMMIVIFLHGTL